MEVRTLLLLEGACWGRARGRDSQVHVPMTSVQLITLLYASEDSPTLRLPPLFLRSPKMIIDLT